MSLCRYSIHKRRDPTRAFRIDPINGTVTVVKPLDRETAAWHNFSAEAQETGCNLSWCDIWMQPGLRPHHWCVSSAAQGRLASSAKVFIKVLDINDNVPRLARDYQPYICEGAQSGEVCLLGCAELCDLLRNNRTAETAPKVPSVSAMMRV